MGKKKSWPWIIAVLFLGWIISDDKSDLPPESKVLDKKIDVRKSLLNLSQDRDSDTKKQRSDYQTKYPKTVVSKTKKSKPVAISQTNNEQKFSAKKMYVDASKLNVRNQPNLNGKRIWTLKRDEEVSVTNKNGDWLYVRGARYQGWVFGSYLTPKRGQDGQRKSVALPAIPKQILSSTKIKNILIERSIGLYNGSCPCPYNTTRAGRRCGKRSAYSRPGGASPLCYSSDISDKQVATYRARL